MTTIQNLERIFRQVCTACNRPAVTLDSRDEPRCPRHVDTIIQDQRPHEEVEEVAP